MMIIMIIIAIILSILILIIISNYCDEWLHVILASLGHFWNWKQK